MYCKWNHPWYGEMTLFNDSIDLDDFILDFTTYAFFTENICCFVAGTQILMADNTTKSIEDVIAGEEVFSYDINTDSQYVTTVVSKVINPKSISMAEVVLDNGAKLVMTDYHPFYTLDGWKSITNYLGYDTLQVGDIVKTIDG
jgi:intein/homing endonuclease